MAFHTLWCNKTKTNRDKVWREREGKEGKGGKEEEKGEEELEDRAKNLNPDKYIHIEKGTSRHTYN